MLTPEMQFKEIGRRPGGNVVEVHKWLEDETKKAEVLGWTKVSIILKDCNFVLLGIPPASKEIP